MRKYRAEQVMRWEEIRDGWRLQKDIRKLAKYFRANKFMKG